MADEEKRNNLTEKDLETVSGGGSWSPHSSGDTPAFRLNQRIKVHNGTISDMTGSYEEIYEYGVITAISTEKSGWFCKEFTYTVKTDKGETWEKVWESDIREI
ncbi:MAG: hypothetical protein PUC32_01290 [Oscillospiraceae bacterium]|nr:hypothetical protein [Oscillospiraceae bacterium]